MYDTHMLSAEKFVQGNQDRWWFSIPRLGSKYNAGDTIIFKLKNYTVHEKTYMQRNGTFKIDLENEWLELISNAHKSKAGTEIHFTRQIDDEDGCNVTFGRLEDTGRIPVDIKVKEMLKR